MKVGFINKINENGIAFISHQYGENAQFNTFDYTTQFENGDIVLFEFSVTKPIVTAIKILNASNSTNVCRENKSKFHISEWKLILKANKELFFEHVEAEFQKRKISNIESLKKYCVYISPLLTELIKYCESKISRWTYYKPGETHHSGLIHHNIFNIPIHSNIIEELTTDKFLYRQVFFNGSQKNQFNPCSDFNVESGNQHLGKFRFGETLENLFLMQGRLEINEDRFNSDSNYKQTITIKANKTHENYLKNLDSKITASELFNLLYYEEKKDIEAENNTLNIQLYKWDYLKLFPEKQNYLE